MAIIHLDRLWVHDANDHLDYVALVLDEFGDDPAMDVKVHVRAGGRITASTTPARLRTLAATVQIVDPAEYTWLDDHLGKPVMVRTPALEGDVGETLWGVYRSLPSTKRDGIRIVELSVTRISGSAAV